MLGGMGLEFVVESWHLLISLGLGQPRQALLNHRELLWQEAFAVLGAAVLSKAKKHVER